jgi:hypothetical protein
VRAALASVVAVTTLAAGFARAEPAETNVEAALAALAAGLDPRVASTLEGIDGTGRRLLAARAYLRAGAQLGERWSWSAEQAAAFEDTAEKRALDAAVARVRCMFESRHPGHTLWVNPEFRSLDLQLTRWNENPRVGLAAANLLTAVEQAAAAGISDTPDGVAALREFLLAHVPAPVPPLAAPGLSPHGRLRAVDFQVESAGRIVAGTETASIATAWIQDRWKERLREAVAAADAGFEGPLASPDEPWHYEFRPQPGSEGSPLPTGCDAT